MLHGKLNPDVLSNKPIGFIGLGAMGGGMVKNFLKQNLTVLAYDISKNVKEEYTKLGAIFEESPAVIASKVNRLFLCLPFGQEVESVLLGSNGVTTSNNSGLRVLDTSTLYSQDSIKFQLELKKYGISYNDCPVSGLPHKANDGSLTTMFGGSKEEFQLFNPYLKIIGDFILHCGPVGSGQMMKAFNNVLYNINIAGLSEIFSIAVKSGLDPNAVQQLLVSGSCKSFASEYFVPKMVNRVFTGDYKMVAALKDIENVKNTTEKLNIDTPMFSSMIKTYMEAIEMGFGKESKSAMLKVYEEKLEHS
ncbi:MAG: NAD(P)-dependent oxidoreductase [Rhodobacterales bacterium]|jgi:3-hydroxyisobutyrate dehydrogenase-like beta-hydroxyacid dehydrogenase|tara:strand:- start:93 stop:1007 length:915 start_codon:yes stop_codon:yes gene_type:complete